MAQRRELCWSLEFGDLVDGCGVRALASWHSQTLARRHSACSLHSGCRRHPESGGVQLAGQGALSSAPRPRRCSMQGKTLGEGRVDRFRTEIKNINASKLRVARSSLSARLPGAHVPRERCIHLLSLGRPSACLRAQRLATAAAMLLRSEVASPAEAAVAGAPPSAAHSPPHAPCRA